MQQTICALVGLSGLIGIASTSAASTGEPIGDAVGMALQRHPQTGEIVFAQLAPSPLPGHGVLATSQQAEAVKQVLQRTYGLTDEQLAKLKLTSVQRQRDGHQLFRFQQHINGVPVLDGRVTALLDSKLQLHAFSGEAALPSAKRPHPLSAAAASAGLTTALSRLGLNAVEHKAHRIDGWRWQLQSNATDKTDASNVVSQVEAHAVFARDQLTLVPAWRYEITVANKNQARLWEIVVADTGAVLRQRSLTRDASYSYRAFADTGDAFQPFDNPQGDQTPHPTGTAEPPLAPPYVDANLVTLQNLPFSRNDPWLPDNASDLRGNNADVYLDQDGTDGFTAGDRRVLPSGASSFDYRFEPAVDVSASTDNQNAAMVQAFYTVNWLHDLFYDAGFDEAAGNGQQNNFGRGGSGGDRLLLEIQDSEGRNNANMSVPSDGSSPKMQVFLFDGPTTHSLTLTGALTTSFDTGIAAFGDRNFDETAEVVMWDDGIVGTDSDPATNDADASVFDGCEDLVGSPTPVTGKIALIDRGWCKFQEKVANAEQAGALGVIIANHLDDSLLTMAAIDGGPTVTIGSLFIGKSDGATLRAAGSGTVTARMQRETGLDIDGAFDNALVAHEWGHYLNNRLMFISSQQSQGMDEGWSDVVALIALSRNGDDPDGVYAFSGYTTQDYFNGLRRFPYSTDLSKNGLTFRHIADGEPLPNGGSGANNAEEHNTGEVWASMLWEGYSTLLSRYPFTEARNRMLDSMVRAQSLMPNDPDFIQARTAVLTAITDPDDKLVFWQGFAKRGLGVGALAPAKSNSAQTGLTESFVAPTPPTANAGSDQSVVEGSTVTLTGSGSDADGGVLTYRWSQLSGAPVNLANATAASTTFRAPTVNADALLEFQLTVTDNTGLSANDTVNITVTNSQGGGTGGGGSGGGGGSSSALAALFLSVLLAGRRRRQ